MSNDIDAVNANAATAELQAVADKLLAAGDYEQAENVQTECTLRILRDKKKITDCRISLAFFTSDLDLALESSERSVRMFSAFSIGEAVMYAVEYAQKFINWYSRYYTFSPSEQLRKCMEHILALLQLAKELLLTCPGGAIPIQTAALINLQSRMIKMQTQTANVHHRQ